MSEEESLEDIRRKKREELRERQTDNGAATPAEPVHVDGAAELNDAIQRYNVVLADFYADWCGPCQMIEPVVAELASDTDAAVVKVDVDANQPVAAEYGVQGVPTLVLFADGTQVDRFVGMQDRSRLRTAIESHS
ncbi:thioredoxin [Haloarcula amylovorans]|uniref:thioredoxin n=1 Tax=Haloarcula amylovorans TaxID=2562280 RepID=UPI00107656C7|nr:thioredoxin [Halomicroarcula amylolytica]